MPTCFALWCANSDLKGYHMHPFPDDPNLRNSWIANVDRKSCNRKKSVYVCEAHFTFDMFINNDKKILRTDAVPTLFSELNDSNGYLQVHWIEDSCRLCGVDLNGYGIDLFCGEQSVIREVADKFFSLEEKEMLPKRICVSCRIKLEELRNFFQIVTETQDKFEERLWYFENKPKIETLLVDDDSLQDNNLIPDEEYFGLDSENKPNNTSVTPSATEVNQSPIKRFMCEYCSAVFATSTALRTHTRIHTGEKPYTCELCQRHFTNKCSLTCHRRVHTGEKPYSCTFCSEIFNQNPNLTRHMRRKHPGEKPYFCEICQKGFLTSYSLERHLRRCKYGNNPYLCEHCLKCFPNKYKLQEHMRKHIKENLYQCRYCKQNCFNQEKLKQHLKEHTQLKIYSCAICSKVFSHYSGLKLHMKKIHPGEKPYLCKTCEAKFESEYALKLHAKRCRNEFDFVCDHCGMSFVNKGQLAGHIMKHTKEKKFECQICGTRCVTATVLRKHLRVHTGEKPYACSVCGKKFSQSAGLYLHRRKHQLEELQKAGEGVD